jgi:hypothetical protein
LKFERFLTGIGGKSGPGGSSFGQKIKIGLKGGKKTIGEGGIKLYF